jgi:DNA-directed RNA polymerase subunit RPC12/RpoP
MQILVVLAIIIIPGLPFIRFALSGAASAANNRLACPNCGHHFYAKWYQLMFASGSIHAFNYANVKCPKCKILDSCGCV